MRVPPTLEPLIEQGMITEVIRPLMSGKEAQVYLVASNGVPCVAKVYKEAAHRSFKHRADYTEGRKVRSSRTQRAMGRKSRFGKEQIEAAWRNAEVDAIHRLRDADVRVPEPYAFVDGVLLMELVTGDDGEPAPRLADVDLHPDDARDLFDIMLEEVTKMLCAGLVHGDLSDFNVLLGPHGPVIIDFPQATDATMNRNAQKLLVRDVDNLRDFFARWAPELKEGRWGDEMWDLYERGQLAPDTRLTGKFKRKKSKGDLGGLLAEIEELEREARQRREALGLAPRPARKPVATQGPPPRPVQERQRPQGQAQRGQGQGPGPGPGPGGDGPPGEGGKKKRRRRRKKRGGGEGGAEMGPPHDRGPQPPRPPPVDDDPFDDLDALLDVET
ncbi:MAG: serine protein kinase RIO [Alphaproteobacteria bacterium]|nr:serine protein kinase RIO [Alphaproteobacteria bacterium]